MSAAVSGSSGGGGGGQPPDRRKRKADLIDQATKKGKSKLKQKGSGDPKRQRTKSTPTTPAPQPRRSGRASLGQRTVPVPALSFTGGRAGREGECGYFSRTRQWRVANAVQGFIIQKITRTFAVDRYDGPGLWTRMDAATLNAYVQVPGSSVDADCTQYWELWVVRDDGGITHNGDSFSLCSIIPTAGQIANTTRGQFTMVGEAAFYATTVGADVLGFGANGAGPAGVLPHRLTDPAGDLAGRGIVASGVALRYQVDVTWDSSSPSTLSTVVVT